MMIDKIVSSTAKHSKAKQSKAICLAGWMIGPPTRLLAKGQLSQTDALVVKFLQQLAIHIFHALLR